MQYLLSKENAKDREALELASRFLRDSYFSEFIVGTESHLLLENLSLRGVGEISETNSRLDKLRPFILPFLDAARKSPDCLLTLCFRLNMPNERLVTLTSLLGDRIDRVGAEIIFGRYKHGKNEGLGHLQMEVDQLVTRGKWDPDFGDYSAVKKAFTPLQAEVEKNVRRLLRK